MIIKYWFSLLVKHLRLNDSTSNLPLNQSLTIFRFDSAAISNNGIGAFSKAIINKSDAFMYSLRKVDAIILKLDFHTAQKDHFLIMIPA